MEIAAGQRKKKLLAVTIAVFLAMLALSWLFSGTGVVRNDIKRNIYIPQELTMPLQVKAAHNGKKIFFRYRWPAKQPSLYWDVVKFEGGSWKKYGGETPGREPDGLAEDRIAMMVDDGSVPGFDRYGGYITVGKGLDGFTDAVDEEEVEKHPYLGKKKGLDELTKYLPQTRTDPADWAAVISEEDLAAQRKAGYFLDLWQWQASRSNPIDMASDQFIAEGRFSDAGKTVSYANWDEEKEQPRFMFDPAKTGGRAALKWDDVTQRKLGFDDPYYLREDQAKPYDPGYAWKEGDVLPRRVLRRGEGSAADISVVGKARWKDGFWDVTLARAMDTGNPQDDKIFHDHHEYTVAFAVHRDALGGRWHYVSLPLKLGLNHETELAAVQFEGETPKWDQPWLDVKLFYPGQVSWPLLNSRRHAGAEKIRQGVPVKFRHNEAQLAYYGVEMEFINEIRAQWLYTLAAGILLIIGFGYAVMRLLPGKED